MNISANWLRKFLKTDLDNRTLADILTDIGLEVEGLEKIEAVKGGLQGLVIGEVLEKDKHPDADRLSVTKVNVGAGNVLQIVCGAPNVAAGQKVVVALEGTLLYPSEGEPFRIKKSKIRGVESNGMICAEDEIGLGKDHNGIMVLDANAVVGRPAAEYFKLENDEVFIIGLTPNRVDAASHYGVARDLYAALIARGEKAELTGLNTERFSVSNNNHPVKVEISDTENCLRYDGITIRDVKVQASPEWLQQALRNIGLRPINNIVDITNYVLHETGYPLHAFDQDKLKGNKIIVKKANEGDLFVTLDETERKLTGQNLMIADESSLLCIAGVFGGLQSGVTDSTKNVFIESAYFNPVSVRKTARQHGLNTDSSFRFERGADPEMTITALKRAAILMRDIAGGTISSEIVEVYPTLIKPFTVAFSVDRCTQLIGQEIPADEIRRILNLLGIKITGEEGMNWQLEVPAFRVDVQREVDVIEEVLRIYGYNRIVIPEKINASLNHSPNPDPEKVQTTISELLSANGFFEMLNNSLTTDEYVKMAEASAMKEEWNVQLLNPLSSELNVMRQSLLFSGLESIRHNANRQLHDLKFYEFGKIYFKRNDRYEENKRLSVFVTGQREEENWTSASKASSFYDIKSAVELVLKKLGLLTHVKSTAAFSGLLEDGVVYEIAKKKIVELGWVKPVILKKMDVKQDVFYADFDWDALISVIHFNKIRYKEIPKFPAVRRDLSLLLDHQVQFSDIESLAKKSEQKLLREVGLFDVYEGKNLEAGKKSYAVRFILQDEESTLTDEKVEKIMSGILTSLQEKLGAQLR